MQKIMMHVVIGVSLPAGDVIRPAITARRPRKCIVLFIVTGGTRSSAPGTARGFAGARLPLRFGPSCCQPWSLAAFQS